MRRMIRNHSAPTGHFTCKKVGKEKGKSLKEEKKALTNKGTGKVKRERLKQTIFKSGNNVEAREKERINV